MATIRCADCGLPFTQVEARGVRCPACGASIPRVARAWRLPLLGWLIEYVAGWLLVFGAVMSGFTLIPFLHGRPGLGMAFLGAGLLVFLTGFHGVYLGRRCRGFSEQDAKSIASEEARQASRAAGMTQV